MGTWPSHVVDCKLDHGVKGISWIKLVGYSVFNKRQVGFANQHEQIADDWIAVHIDQVDGKVVSNNPHADRAFAVLHVGSSADNRTGAIEFHEQDPMGIAMHVFDTHQTTLRRLTFKFLDRKGKPAHFGRIHLWLKVCAAHG